MKKNEKKLVDLVRRGALERRMVLKASAKDVLAIVKAISSESFEGARKTKTYTKYSPEYCTYLEVIHEKRDEIKNILSREAC